MDENREIKIRFEWVTILLVLILVLNCSHCDKLNEIRGKVQQCR